MGLTLYRKYRPQNFREVVGQNHIKTTIQSELESGKVAHAYLFSGPRGLGKTTMARLLAKAVNCLKRKAGESEPCNDCDSCREIIEGRSLDVIEIDAATHTQVDNVRENIINNSRFTPTSRKYKVFIIDEVHMLSIASFNALLKTLEEPPAHVIFILATTEIHKVPETIISRCQHFDFRKVTENEIIGRLSHIVGREERKVDNSILENIAYYSGGCIRDAESLLGQILSLDGKEITAEQAELVMPRSRFDLNLELIDYLVKKDAGAAIALVNRLVEEGVDMDRFTADLTEVLRKILLLKVSRDLGQYTGGLSKDLEKRALASSQQMSVDWLVKTIEIFLAKRQELKFADVLQLPLELAILEIIGQDNLRAEKKEDKADDDNGRGGWPMETAEEPKPEKKAEVLAKKNVIKSKLNLPPVKEKWEEVLACLKKYNASLAATLKICQPAEISADGTLELCLKHKFHQQRINDLKNKQLLEKVLAEIFGTKLLVRTVLAGPAGDKEEEINAAAENNTDDPVSSLLQAFGGQVID